MKRKLLTITIVAALAMVSCKKETNIKIPDVALKTTSEIIVPAGFTWENSRNIDFMINIYDARYQGIVHVILIYDADPSKGGAVLSKGSATTIAAFRSKIYLSNQIKEVYVVCVAPNNSKVTEKVVVGTTAIDMLINSI